VTFLFIPIHTTEIHLARLVTKQMQMSPSWVNGRVAMCDKGKELTASTASWFGTVGGEVYCPFQMC
jgi:hypothetical protein